MQDLDSLKITRLTTDGSKTLINGTSDWVYEEEFGMAQAWNWSPDSRHIAFWQLDESAEPVNQFTDFSGRHPEWTDIRIPQPGDSNPRVKISFAISVASASHFSGSPPPNARASVAPR